MQAGLCLSFPQTPENRFSRVEAQFNASSEGSSEPAHCTGSPEPSPQLIKRMLSDESALVDPEGVYVVRWKTATLTKLVNF